MPVPQRIFVGDPRGAAVGRHLAGDEVHAPKLGGAEGGGDRGEDGGAGVESGDVLATWKV